MNTKVVRIREEEKTREALEKNPGLLEAAEILRNGGLVAFPTETVYGLGANALNEEAAKKIYAAKGRPSDNPLIAHISCMEELPAIVKEIPEAGRKLAEKYWPGPLTMIFPKKDIVPYGTTGGLDTVAVRMPSDPVANCLIHLAGVPVAAPSANTSGRPSPTKAEHVIEDMDGKIEMVIDGGAVGIGVESTIVDVSSEVPTLLRPGAITIEMLRETLGQVDIDPVILGPVSGDIKPKAPGMKYRHYAPKAPVTVVTGPAEASARTILQMVKPGDGVICFDEFAELFKEQEVECLGPSQDKRIQAQRVFDALRAFDSKDAAQIYAQCPDSQGLGLAISNRLKKAAGAVFSSRLAHTAEQGERLYSSSEGKVQDEYSRALLRASIDKRDEKAITDAMDKVNASIDAKTKADEERKAQEEAAAAAAAQAQSTPAPQQYSYTPSGSASGSGSGPTGGGYHSSGGSAGSTGGSASPGWSVPANPDPSQLPGTDPSL